MWIAILNAIAAIPKIVDGITSLVSRIDALIEYQQLKQKAEDLKIAIEKARKTGDTSDIEAIFRGKK